MTSRLAEISALSVTSRTSTLRYKGTTRSLRDIGADLGVEYVLEGTVRTDRSPDGTGQVRVTPQLIRVSDDSHLWTDRYTASLAPGEIFMVQAQIAERVATALDVTLLGSERAALREVLTTDPEAHDAYLLGRFHWNKRGAENLKRAAGHFGRAIERDPDFAEAHIGLADTYALFPYYAVPGVTRAEAYAQAESAARRAIALDSTLAAAYASLGNILTYGAWDWEGAEREFERAIALDPDYAVTRYWYAELLIILGRTTEAIEQAKYAIAYDPAALMAGHLLASTLWREGRLDEAIVRQRAALELEPGFVFGHSLLGFVYAEKRQFDTAIREFELAGAPLDLATAVIDALRDTTARARAVAVISRYERQRAGDAVTDPAVFAQWYLMVGAVDSAFARLEDAYQIRSETLIFDLRAPNFEAVQSDPRYADLLRRLRLEP
ncbi:MAG: tetratricopeptide repeat protein [Gemmatimonadales bacterium]